MVQKTTTIVEHIGYIVMNVVRKVSCLTTYFLNKCTVLGALNILVDECGRVSRVS